MRSVSPRIERNAAILTAVLEGQTLATTGLTYGLSPARVRMIVQRLIRVLEHARYRVGEIPDGHRWQLSMAEMREHKELWLRRLAKLQASTKEAA